MLSSPVSTSRCGIGSRVSVTPTLGPHQHCLNYGFSVLRIIYRLLFLLHRFLSLASSLLGLSL
ncbi:unnamed protein product [Brassica rapa subsp. narinosa]